MNDLEREMQSILDVARQAHEPVPGDAARVRQALAVTLAGTATSVATGSAAASVVAGAGSGSGAGGAAGLGSASSLFSVAKYGAIGLLVGTSGIGVGAAVYEAADPVAPPAAAHAVVEPHPVREPVTHQLPADESPQQVHDGAETEPQPPRAALPSSAEGSPATSTELRAEARALHRAERSLESDPERALRQLDTMQRAHPDGVLTEEVLAARVFAHCNLGDSARARQVADRLLREFPRSVHAPRVRASCAMSTSPSNPPSTTACGDGSHVPTTIDE